MDNADRDQVLLLIRGSENQQQLKINKYLTVDNIKASQAMTRKKNE